MKVSAKYRAVAQSDLIEAVHDYWGDYFGYDQVGFDNLLLVLEPYVAKIIELEERLKKVEKQ